MSKLLHEARGVSLSCHVALAEIGRIEAAPPDVWGADDPPVRIGSGSLFVATRCPGIGEAGLELWSGDPGLPPGWQTLFDGTLETRSNGFDVGEVGADFHIAAAPGQYRVRADVRLDDKQVVDIVRFVFPENEDLTGDVVPSSI